jgi:hypothetical protein
MSRRYVNTGWLILAFALAQGANARAQEVTPPRAQSAVAAIDRPNALRGRVADLPPQWVERLQDMSPAQQERFLRNNARFRNLPLERQAQIRRRLRIWNALSLDERQSLIERQQVWEQLPPEQRRQVREFLLPRWQSLPAARRRVILNKLRDLRGLDGAGRNARLADESFLGTMNGEDRQMLRDLSSLGVDDTDG